MVEQPKRAAFIYSIVFFSMEKGKYSTNLEMFPVKSRPGSLTAIGQNIISINWQGMAAVFSLGLSGYILRRLQETGAKFLDGERTKGDCSSPKWDPLFRRTTGKFDASKLILMHVCIYIYIYMYLNVNRETFMATAYEFQFASTPPPPLGVTRSYTQWNPLLRLILLSCAENVARTACESWHLPQLRDTCFLESTEFVITLEVEKFE